MSTKDPLRQPEPTDAFLDWAATLAGLGPKPVPERRARLIAQGILPPNPTLTDKNGEGRRDEAGAAVWEQIFVRARDPRTTPDAFFKSLPENPESGLTYDPFERAYAEAFYGSTDAPVDAVLYRRRDPEPTLAAQDLPFEVLAVGGLLAQQLIDQPIPLPEPNVSTSKVAFAIIDDALPILHERSTRGFTSTRFSFLWSQVLLANQPGMPALGLIETAGQLDTLLARLGSEGPAEVYAERARALYPYGTRHALSDPASHGSVMFDCAAGVPAAAADPLKNVPILGVQLPPQSFDDTSGRRLRIPLLQAIRWSIFLTFLLKIADNLVINASLGIVAGPKNGRSWLEHQIAREIQRASAFTGNSEAVHLTLPYGNAHEDRLVARFELADDTAASVPVRVLPDDRTPSFVEIRTPASGPDLPDIAIGIQGPTAADVVPTAVIPPGGFVDLPGLVGRIYHIAPQTVGQGVRDDGHFVIAFAPTAATVDGDALVRPGLWTIDLRNVSGAALDLTVQVQRDDSPFPRQTGARQSYLEFDNDRQWNRRRRSFDGLGNGPLTHAGTNSAYATIPHPNVTTVGGAIVPPYRDLEPADYTAKGASWSGTAPDGAALTETGHATTGVRASGMSGAATARLAGTSTASATAARDLLLDRLSEPPLPRRNIAQDDRLGSWVLIDNPAIRS